MAATSAKKVTGSTNATTSKKVAGPIHPQAAPETRALLKGALIVFFTALAVRLIYFASVRHCPLFQSPSIDAKAYYDLAVRFASNDWLFPQGETYWQPPFYPAVIAVWMHVVGRGVIALKLLQLTLGSLNCALIYVLGARVFDKKIGLIAGLAAALYAPMIYFDGELLTPTVQTFFNLCVILLLFSAAAKRSVPLFAASGLVFGLSIIARPDVAGFLPVAVVWTIAYLCKSTPRMKLAAMCALLIVCSLAPIVPLAIRNSTVGGEDVLISRNGGINFYIGNNANERKTQDIRPGSDWETLIEMPRVDYPEMKPAEQNSWFYAKALDWAGSNPGGYLLLQLRKMGQYITAVEGRRNHDLYFYRNYSPLYSLLIFRLGTFAFPFGIVFPLAVFGMLRSRWDKRKSLLYCYLATQMLATVAFFVCARYRLTAIPVLLLFAAFGATELLTVVRSREWKRAALPLGLAAAALVFTNANIYQIDTNRRCIDAETHYYVARAYADTGSKKGACAEYEKALDLDSKYQDTYLYYAMTLADMGKKEEARKTALTGLRLCPTSQAANEKCGNILMDAGDLWGALRCFQSADALHPWSCPNLAKLADAGCKQRDYLLVMKAFETMYRIQPELPGLRGKLERIQAAYSHSLKARPGGK